MRGNFDEEALHLLLISRVAGLVVFKTYSGWAGKLYRQALQHVADYSLDNGVALCTGLC